jgi:DNA processing protein
MTQSATVFKEKATSFNEEERLAYIRLIRSQNIGLKTFYSLLELYGTAEAALQKAEEMTARGTRKIQICSRERALEEISHCEEFGARIITLIDNEYPDLLKEIADPPPVFTAIGNIDLLNKKSVAIVGARNATANGCRFAYKIAEELGDEGYATVSGLARGIDTAAHKGSLGTGTIAVIAGGIDNIYPPENAGLYEQIKESGIIIAELPFGAAPKAQNFPQRNRIISGLSLGTLIVEAATRSGSLITSRFAMEQGREVFAVPGSPLDPRAEGPNKLIKDGATLVESVNDIIDGLTHPTRPIQTNIFEEERATPIFEDLKTDIESSKELIESSLSTTPADIDDLIDQTNLPASIVQVAILELELSGHLTRHPGNKVSLLA